MLLESVVGMRGGHVGHVDVDIAFTFLYNDFCKSFPRSTSEVKYRLSITAIAVQALVRPPLHGVDGRD